jgi:hypothetical protein
MGKGGIDGMNPPDVPKGPTALAARWRKDADVLRRYGATGRARMLEHLAGELELSTTNEAAAPVDLSTAAELSGFTRGHLRRLYREGKLIAVAVERGEPLFRVSDLPRKPGGGPAASDQPLPVSRAHVARGLTSSDVRAILGLPDRRH